MCRVCVFRKVVSVECPKEVVRKTNNPFISVQCHFCTHPCGFQVPTSTRMDDFSAYIGAADKVLLDQMEMATKEISVLATTLSDHRFKLSRFIKDHYDEIEERDLHHVKKFYKFFTAHHGYDGEQNEPHTHFQACNYINWFSTTYSGEEQETQMDKLRELQDRYSGLQMLMQDLLKVLWKRFSRTLNTDHDQEFYQALEITVNNL